MQRHLSRLGVAAAFSLALFSAAQAAGITVRRFFRQERFAGVAARSARMAAGGKYSNNLTGDGTWSLSGSRLHIHTDRYDYVATVQKTPDGTFQADIAAANIKTTGKYCQ